MTEEEFLKELACIIFLHRKKKKRTLGDLADAIGSNSKYLRAIELGQYDPPIGFYLKIAKELNISLDEIEKIINTYFKQINYEN